MHDTPEWDGTAPRTPPASPASPIDDDASAWNWVTTAYAGTAAPRPGAADHVARLVAAEVEGAARSRALASARSARRWAVALAATAACAAVAILAPLAGRRGAAREDTAGVTAHRASPAPAGRETTSETGGAGPSHAVASGAARAAAPPSREARVAAAPRADSTAPTSRAAPAAVARATAELPAEPRERAVTPAPDSRPAGERGAAPALPGSTRSYALLRLRLADSTYAELTTVVAAAAARGLPPAPLLDRALQGSERRASEAALLAAVRAVAARLDAARAALGAASSDGELAAGAEALLNGATPASLAQVRASRAPGAAVVPLVVLADLVASGVGAEEASSALATVMRSEPERGTSPGADEAMLALRAEVAADVARGAAPAAALSSRVRSRAVEGQRPPAMRPAPPPRPAP